MSFKLFHLYIITWFNNFIVNCNKIIIKIFWIIYCLVSILNFSNCTERLNMMTSNTDFSSQRNIDYKFFKYNICDISRLNGCVEDKKNTLW